MLIRPTVSTVDLSRCAQVPVVLDDRRSSPGLPMLQVYDLQVPLKVLQGSEAGRQPQQKPQAGPTRSQTRKRGLGTENVAPQQLTDGTHPPKQPPRRAPGQQAALQGRSLPINGAAEAGHAPAKRIQHSPHQAVEAKAGRHAEAGKVAPGRQPLAGLPKQHPAHRQGQDRPDAAVRRSSTSLAQLASSK